MPVLSPDREVVHQAQVPSIQAVGKPKQGGQALEAGAVIGAEGGEIGVGQLGHGLAGVTRDQRQPLDLVLAPTVERRVPNKVRGMLMVAALRDEMTDAMEDRRSVENLTVGGKKAMHIG